MKKVVLLGDGGSHPGQMITATGSVKNNGVAVCLDGDLFDCQERWPNGNPHGVQPVYANYGHLKITGKSVLTTGSTAACGCVVAGSSTFQIFD